MNSSADSAHACVLRAINTSSHHFSIMNLGTGKYKGYTNSSGSYSINYNSDIFSLEKWGIISIYTKHWIYRGALLALLSVFALGLMACSSKNDEVLIRNVIDICAIDIDYIMISPEVYYLDDDGCDTSEGLWITVDDTSMIEQICELIGNIPVTDVSEQGPLEGGGPRYVVLFTKSETQYIFRFVDDQQVQIEDVLYAFCAPFDYKSNRSFYEELDGILGDYEYVNVG